MRQHSTSGANNRSRIVDVVATTTDPAVALRSRFIAVRSKMTDPQGRAQAACCAPCARVHAAGRRLVDSLRIHPDQVTTD